MGGEARSRGPDEPQGVGILGGKAEGRNGGRRGNPPHHYHYYQRHPHPLPLTLAGGRGQSGGRRIRQDVLEQPVHRIAPLDGCILHTAHIGQPCLAQSPHPVATPPPQADQHSLEVSVTVVEEKSTSGTICLLQKMSSEKLSGFSDSQRQRSRRPPLIP